MGIVDIVVADIVVAACLKIGCIHGFVRKSKIAFICKPHSKIMPTTMFSKFLRGNLKPKIKKIP